jgi:hypothetical protein
MVLCHDATASSFVAKVWGYVELTVRAARMNSFLTIPLMINNQKRYSIWKVNSRSLLSMQGQSYDCLPC